jgi:hypothetical protein
MTDNAANIAMSNEALDLLGADRITVGATTEQNYIFCAGVFDQIRDETLAFHKWNFAKKRAYAVETTKPIFGPEKAYTYPTDAIKIWVVDENPLAKFEVEGGLVLTDEGATPSGWATATAYVANQYVSNNDVSYLCILAHTSGDTDDEPGVGATTATYWTATSGDLAVLPLEYVYQRTDVDAWPEYARRANIINLASKLAAPIKQNEEAALNLQAMLHGSKKVTGYLDIARSIDAQEQGGVTIKTTQLINDRRGRRGFTIR